MFATGDFHHWMVVKKDELIGNYGDKFYEKQEMQIYHSSESAIPYIGEWARRENKDEDPDLKILLDGETSGSKLKMYKGNSKEDEKDNQTLNSDHGGMDVYINNSTQSKFLKAKS